MSEIPSKPITRKEQYLAKAAGQAVEIPAEPITREEAYLDAIAKGSGGGGGTSDYSQLSNKPQINGTTLTGNKSASDLSLASTADLAGKVDKVDGKGLSTNDYTDADKAIVGGVTAALAGKQDTLTAGNYIAIESNAIRVNRTLTNPTIPYTYRVHTTSTDGTYASVDIDKKDESGVVIDSVSIWFYEHQGIANAVTMDDFIQIYYDNHWICNLLKNSTTHQAGYQQSWNWNQSVDFNEVYDMEVDLSGKKLIIKDEMDTALAGKQDILTFDSVPTDGSTNPVESNGVYDALATKANASDVTTALATKQDATDNNLQTTDKTVVGGINELKSGFTTLDNEVNGDSTTYPYADVITIEDAIPANLADCNVKIEPVQDLHGYDKPWVGGAGKNIIPLTVSGIKSFNTIGTWTGNVYSVNGVTIELLTDSDNNVTGVKLNGSNNSGTAFDFIFYYGNMSNMVSIGGTYTVTGCTVTDGRTHEYSGTFTIDSDWYINAGFIKIYVGATKSFDNEIRYPQLEVGNQATTFAPYTNICPISGHTEASVQRDGKNLCPVAKMNTLNSNTFKLNAGTYALSFKMAGSSMYSTSSVILRDDSDTEVLSIGVGGASSGTVKNGQFTLQSEKTLHLYVNNISADASGYYIDDIQIEKGQTATPYEPYAGKTYTIALGDTIYGGTVDFNTGVMTVDRAVVDLGDFTWSTPSAKGAVSSTTSISGAINPQSNYNKANMDCSNYWVLPYYVDGVSGHDANSTDGAFAIWVTDGNKLFIRDLHLAGKTAEETKTYLTGVQVLYKLATPTTIQLTPQQIQLLQGQNTLTASTGEISVTVNGVAGSIGQVQEQVNATDEALAELAEKLPTAPTTDGAYVLTVTVADGTPTYSWESAT